MNKVAANIKILGCGDIGRRVAYLYLQQGNVPEGWVRSETSLQAGLALGLKMRQIDADTDSTYSADDFYASQVFWLMPPPDKGITDSRLRRFLNAVGATVERIVLISTTGVYGDCQGRWIDESEPLKPHTDRAKRRVDAEQALHTWARRFGRQYVILRVPGIYALDRLPLERLRRGEPVINASEAPWSNRIHADDLAIVCQRAMEIAPTGAIYNTTDGFPSTMTDYFNQIATYAGLPLPPQISLADAQNKLGAGILSYLQESRRIHNDKLLQDLQLTLRYPSLASALQAATS